ncbi:2'-5' RNA ligase family protein [Myxococcota bacterium]|nr:2'-5' RNA ligase family protein [Myxococcota bacterium]
MKRLCQGLGPVNRSAVVIIPPQDLSAPIQAIRAAHDKSYARWMPHINLLYGFLPEAHFAEAADVISRALAEFEPFTLSLNAFKRFDHGKSETIWLEPLTAPHAQQIHRLQAILQAAFPQCDELVRRGDEIHGYQPHLTVGQSLNRAETPQLMAAWQAKWAPIEFEVGQVALISRRGDGPFEIRHIAPFGQPEFNALEAPSDPLSALRLGQRLISGLEWTSQEVQAVKRLCLLNHDESGSMYGEIKTNAEAFNRVTPLLDDHFDAIILHGFGSDSLYSIYTTLSTAELFKDPPKGLKIEVHPHKNAKTIIKEARDYLKKRDTHGSTCPKSHPIFLSWLADRLDARDDTIELSVISTSDGGFDGDAPKEAIRAEMLRLTSRCRCRLAVNVLVGSYGSPDALFFFTGDPDAFTARILFSTVKADEGVLKLQDFRAKDVDVGESEGGEHITLRPSTPFWALESEVLRIYWPEGVTPPEAITIKRHVPQPGGRELLMQAEVRIEAQPVRIEEDAREMFALVARCFDDNPYLRDSARGSLNEVLAQLEALLGVRDARLAELTALPEEKAQLDRIKARLDENMRQIDAARRSDLSLRALSGRMNTLNQARRALKRQLRDTRSALDQQMLERELDYMRAHPDHWTVWLKPAMDEIKSKLEATQEDVGGAMQHLSTRIRSKKSREDGQTRSVDRHIEKLLARARDRHDARDRAADPQDHVPFEAPAIWLDARCPISQAPLHEGLAGLPFVADRSDITSGNVAAGGQNVDRVDVALEPFIALDAARDLMWGPLGQMPSPFSTGRGVYNAVIPALLGPATPAKIRKLEKAIGWLCTGTSAFEAPMAEAIPGALASVLGRPGDQDGAEEHQRRAQAHALLRTTALFDRLWSYPYVEGTSVLDEAAPRLPLSVVWEKSLATSGEAASLRSSGCTTSLLAKAVGAESLDVEATARGLFMWCCRNIARGILSDKHEDGRGGVEGIKRLAALLRLSVELAGYPPQTLRAASRDYAAPRALEVSAPLSEAQLRFIFGAHVDHWDLSAPVTAEGFTEALNRWMSALDEAALSAFIEDLGAVLTRLDEVLGEIPDEGLMDDADRPTPGRPSAVIAPLTHDHFGILSLEAVTPTRAYTPAPALADDRLHLRRILKANITTWTPPRDAHLPSGQLNPSALRFINEHSALWPMRAFLRLQKAGLLGRRTLEALRKEEATRGLPQINDVLSAMADLMGGVEPVILMIYRAFAFVVEHAEGYADKHWAESPLREAGLKRVAEVLELNLEAASEAPTRYGPARIDLDALSPDINWPKMDARGWLPKHKAVNAQGELIGARFKCSEAEAALQDPELCQLGFAHIAEIQMKEEGERFIGGLHRHARATLGAYPVDLRSLDRAALIHALKIDLVPKLAGKARGVPSHPSFFSDCAHILYEMSRLGTDTRALRGEEEATFIHDEAEEIRRFSAQS